jgi:hypothetical protein
MVADLFGQLDLASNGSSKREQKHLSINSIGPGDFLNVGGSVDPEN